MLNRFTRGTVAVAGALLTFGAVSTMLATAAGATVTTADNAGYQAGNGAWNFRYVSTTFTVPELACTGQDDFVAAGVQLVGSLSSATLGVYCNGSTPTVGWGTSSLNAVSYGNLIVSDDDNVSVSVYYDTTTGYDYFYALDNTTGASDTWAHKAGVAEYHYADAGAMVNNPLQYPPTPGQNYVLVPFTSSTATSYNGTHGTGLDGPWGVAEIEAINGAHIIAAAPVLYDSGSTFNVRVYGNS